MQKSRGCALLFVAATWCHAGTLYGQTSWELPSKPETLAGPRITATWQGQELGAVLDRVASVTGRLIWLDRRVDPQRVINAQFSKARMSEIIMQLGRDESLMTFLWDEAAYLGPPDASDVATLVALGRDQASQLPAEMRRRWLTPQPISWPRLTDPRKLLDKWLANEGIKLIGPEQLPHDLWRQKDLPAISLVDRAVVVLAGFDMTCRISPDGKTCRIVPIVQPVQMVRDYPAAGRGRLLHEAFKDNPKVLITRHGENLTITGTWEDHLRAGEILRTQLNGKRRRVPHDQQEARSTFSLRLVDKPVGKVVDQLAQQLKLKLVWSADESARNTLVSCEVADGTLDELLNAVLAPANLQFELSGEELKIHSVR